MGRFAGSLALPAFALLALAVFGLFALHVQLHRVSPHAATPVQPFARLPSQQCVVMFDNRPAPPPTHTTDLSKLPYLSLSVATNSLYARHHGYRFLFYNFSKGGCRHPTLEGQTKDLPMTWCKLVVLEDALLHGRDGPPCEIVLLLDSDAVVSDFGTRIEHFVAEHGQGRTVLLAHLDNETMAMDDEALWKVHGVQRSHPWMFFSRPGGGNYLNAGVMLFQRGDGRLIREMLDEWWRSALKEPPLLEEGRPRPCWGNCLLKWPHEQAVFEMFVWPRFREDVAVLPLGLLNGFSGHFVRHIWGLVKDRRGEAMREALATAAASVALPEVAAAAAAAGWRPA